MNYEKPPIQTPFLDSDGRVSQPWYLFLNNIFITLSRGQSNATLEQILGLALEALTKKDPEIQVLAKKLEDLQFQVNASQKIDLTTIYKKIEDLQFQINSFPKIDISLIYRRLEDLQAQIIGKRNTDLTTIYKKIEDLQAQLLQLSVSPKVNGQQFDELRDYVYSRTMLP